MSTPRDARTDAGMRIVRALINADGESNPDADEPWRWVDEVGPDMSYHRVADVAIDALTQGSSVVLVPQEDGTVQVRPVVADQMYVWPIWWEVGGW